MCLCVSVCVCVCVCVYVCVCVCVCVYGGYIFGRPLFTHTMNQETGKEEYEIEDFNQTSKGTELKAYVLVDLDNEIAYGFKVRKFFVRLTLILQ